LELDIFAQKEYNLSGREWMGIAAKSILDFQWEVFENSDFIVILTGPGNNGGDGFALGYFLSNLGKPVEILEIFPSRSPEAILFRDACKKNKVVFADISSWNPDWLGKKNPILIEAVFGVGKDPNREVPDLENLQARFMDWKKKHSNLRLVSLDCRSDNFPADEIWELENYKRENMDYRLSRKIKIPIGFPTKRFLESKYSPEKPFHKSDSNSGPIEIGRAYYLERSKSTQPATRFFKSEGSHKYTRGAVSFLGGAPSMEGAIALSLKAFLNLGGGITKVYPISDRFSELFLPHHPSWMIGPSPQDVRLIREDSFFQKSKLVVVGPGTPANALANLLPELIRSNPDKFWIIDGGAIPVFTKDWDKIFSTNTLLTPHTGEFLRLIRELGDTHLDLSHEDLKGFLEVGQKITPIIGSWILLKSSFSILFSPNGEAWIWDFPNPKLATMGTGDVLTGILASGFLETQDWLEAAYSAWSLIDISKQMPQYSPNTDQILDFLSKGENYG
jgi:hydroxyethylthiazole kinase-like uncharacterized protein yjeF